jgi:flagellar biosynthesis/type III secretory pathway chaperone
MEFDVNKLAKILGKQKILIEELRELANEQLQALQQDDINKIIKITSHQEYIGRQLAVLEQQRCMILENFSQEHGIKINHFSDLLPHTSSDDFAEIQKSRDEVINGCQKLKEEQGLNALLLKQGLKYAERMLEVLNSKKTSTYGKTGNMKRAGNSRIVDANV